MLALVLGWAGSARADQYADVNALLRQGRANEALAKADAYVATNPRDPQMRFLRGVILTDQGKQAEAISAFTALTQEFPELPEPYNNLAALYAAQSEFGKARDALETALQRNPNYATAHENLGDVYVRLAAQSYTKAQQLDKRNTTVAPKLTLLREVFLPKAAAAKVPPAQPAAAAPATDAGTPAQR
ncbi:tetratricopeptide repeat protein [Variovorax soli]|uniref:tetratricopeptide repeat protein n=1 Tax=Variovorax soli TaxID=376815 RepID=UPI001FE1BF61|nr:tetratricopeptide repeat protein [Variovorax soli]